MRRLPVLLFATGVFVCSGCGHDNPTRPSPSSAAVPSSLAIGGNTTFTSLGETSRLTATVTFSDGTMRDVTPEVSWFPKSADEAGVVVINAGLMTATRWGRSQFTATYMTSHFRSITTSSTATVLPPGHFVLKGRVAEGGFALFGASVVLTTSTGEQYATTSDNHTALYQLPAAGSVTVRAEKAGYTPAIQQLTVDRDQDFDIDMRRADAVGDIRGVYTLTMTASSSCKLPAEVMQRQYTARIDEVDGKVIVEVGGAEMEAMGRAGFSGTRDGNAVRFVVGEGYFDDEMFVELVKPNYHLGYTGTATESADVRRISGAFNGWMHYRGPTYNDVVECQAADHRMEFVR